MPCGCSNNCGCNVIAGTSNVSVVQMGDTFVVNVVEDNLVDSVVSDNCISLDVDGSGALTAAVIIDPNPTCVDVQCGVDGLRADIVIDPASTAPISCGPDGLKVDCCGIVNPVELQGNPDTLADPTCENRLRYNNSGELTSIPDGISIIGVSAGTRRGVPSPDAADGTVSLNDTYTNDRDCAVLATFKCIGIVEVEHTDNTPAQEDNSQSRIISLQMRAESGGATTGSNPGSSGIHAFTAIDDAYLLSTSIKHRWQSLLEINFVLDPGEVAEVNVYTHNLEEMQGYDGTTAASATNGFTATNARWTIQTIRQ